MLIFVVVVDYLGMGITYTAIPFLFFDTNHHTLVSQYSNATRALLLGWLFAMSSLGRFFGAPILGKMSDRWGRRKALLLTLTMTFVSTLLTAESITINLLWLLFLSRFLIGLFAGNIAISQASLVDSAERSNKVWRLNLLEMGMAAGLMLGPHDWRTLNELSTYSLV